MGRGVSHLTQRFLPTLPLLLGSLSHRASLLPLQSAPECAPFTTLSQFDLLLKQSPGQGLGCSCFTGEVIRGRVCEGWGQLEEPTKSVLTSELPLRTPQAQLQRIPSRELGNIPLNSPTSLRRLGHLSTDSHPPLTQGYPLEEVHFLTIQVVPSWVERAPLISEKGLSREKGRCRRPSACQTPSAPVAGLEDTGGGSMPSTVTPQKPKCRAFHQSFLAFHQPR